MINFASLQQMQQSGVFAAVQLPTVSDVEKFQPQLGVTMIVMAQDKPIFALKAADRMGMVNASWYKYGPYNPEEDKPHYVTTDELEKILERFTQNFTATGNKRQSEPKSTLEK